jgi:hypothetical protein
VSCATAATLNATQAASVRINSFFIRNLLFELIYGGSGPCDCTNKPAH